MRYFTRGWANGELSNAEDERIRRDYAARLDEIAPRLPASLVRLRDGVSLHDALIERVVWKPAFAELHLRLVAGAVENGYQTIDLVYRGAMLGEQRIASLRNAAQNREACVLYQELDIDDDGALTHRLLFWPNEEVTIDFRTLDYTSTPRADALVVLGGAFVVESGTEE